MNGDNPSNRFLIGMYGRWDQDKYRRDYRSNFWGVEACMFADRAAAQELVSASKREGFRFGVHFPLIKPDSIYRDPLLMALDLNEREISWRSFEQEVLFSAENGAAYILTHFPKPVLVNRSMDLEYWRFAGEKEWMFADEYPESQLTNLLGEMFYRIDMLAESYGIPIFLENDAMCSTLADTDLLSKLFDRYPRVGLCLDIGRLHLQSSIDSRFDGLKFTHKMAPYVRFVHLWNTNPLQNQVGGHYPVLPSQRLEEGWADTGGYLGAICGKRNDFFVLFEHRSDLISEADLERCYEWVRELLGA